MVCGACRTSTGQVESPTSVEVKGVLPTLLVSGNRIQSLTEQTTRPKKCDLNAVDVQHEKCDLTVGGVCATKDDAEKCVVETDGNEFMAASSSFSQLLLISDSIQRRCTTRSLILSIICIALLLSACLVQSWEIVYWQAMRDTWQSFNTQTFTQSFLSKAMPKSSPAPVIPIGYFAVHSVFVVLEMMLLLFAALCHYSKNPRCFARRRYFCACAVVFFLFFVVLRLVCSSMKFSMLWVSDCSEYESAEHLRLSKSSNVFEKVASELQASRELYTSNALGSIYVAINSVPREHRYVTQTLAALLGGLSSDELSQLQRVEILADNSTIELEHIAALEGLKSLVSVVYNPNARQTPRGGSSASWAKGSILHYSNALERCIYFNASSCLVLDDDTIAAKHWVNLANRAATEIDLHSQAIPSLRSRATSSVAEQPFGAHPWTMIKLFQPVWGNERQAWTGKPQWLLLLSILFGGIPGWILGCFCGHQSHLHIEIDARSGMKQHQHQKISRYLCGSPLWALKGMFLALFCLWALSAANVNSLIGDGFVHPYGTCHMAQANLFHRRAVEQSGLHNFLLERAHSPRVFPIDTSICDFFTKDHPTFGPMWATSPSLFQHVGLKTSLAGKSSHGCRISAFHEGLWQS